MPSNSNMPTPIDAAALSNEVRDAVRKQLEGIPPIQLHVFVWGGRCVQVHDEVVNTSANLFGN